MRKKTFAPSELARSVRGFRETSSFLLIVLVAAACAPASVARPPPSGAFYFPSGIVYQEFGPAKEGFLYVANANYDKRYDSGSVAAVRLSSVPGLPHLDDPVSQSGPIQIADLGGDFSQVYIQSFAGEMAGYVRLLDPNGNPVSIRLFVPTRAEGDLLEIVDAQGTTLKCLNGGTNCIDPSLSLTALEKVGNGKPRAPEPVGVGVSPQGEVIVTHLKAADSPIKTNQSLETYVVDLDTQNPVIDASSFISLGLLVNGAPSTSSVALGQRYAYLSSRYISVAGAMVFLLDRQTRLLFNPFLEGFYQTLESRGIALGRNEGRLYVAGRNPDSMVVVNIADPLNLPPTLRLVRGVALPEAPNQVMVIPRPQRGDLVAVTSSTAGVVSIYDDDVGRLVSQISGVGSQPFGLALQKNTNQDGIVQARIFVSNFGDGRIAVIDIPDLLHPERARLVAHLGKAQTCLLQENDASCLGTIGR